MKKRVGMLYGKPIIVGDKNDQTVNEIYLSSGELIENNGSEKPKLKIYLYSKDSTDIVRIDDIEYIKPSNKIVTINSKELNDKYKNHTVHDIIFIFIPSLEQPEIVMELSPAGIERNGDLFVVMMKLEEIGLEVGVAFTY